MDNSKNKQEDVPSPEKLKQYWKKNLQIVGILLVVWFACSYGAAILFAEQLNKITMGGFKLGFWFAQQGAIFVFVAIIIIYIRRMNKLDKEFDVDED